MYVAYSYWSYNGNRVSVMKWNGATWSNVGIDGFSAGAAAYAVLKVVSATEMYVAYRDDANGYRVTVMKWDGST
jgi:hypothetical protein